MREDGEGGFAAWFDNTRGKRGLTKQKGWGGASTGYFIAEF